MREFMGKILLRVLKVQAMHSFVGLMYQVLIIISRANNSLEP